MLTNLTTSFLKHWSAPKYNLNGTLVCIDQENHYSGRFNFVKLF